MPQYVLSLATAALIFEMEICYSLLLSFGGVHFAVLHTEQFLFKTPHYNTDLYIAYLYMVMWLSISWNFSKEF